MQLELTSRDVKIILQALALLPYHEVAALIRKIVWQASVQMKEPGRWISWPRPGGNIGSFGLNSAKLNRKILKNNRKKSIFYDGGYKIWLLQ